MPADEAQRSSALRAYLAERDTAWVRFAVIFFNAPLYLWFLPHDPSRHALALFVTVVAVGYALIIVVARPYERFPILRTARYTLVTDSTLITLWLYATGGIGSPFYGLWALSLLAITFRFGPHAVGLATITYMLADLAMLTVSGDLAGNVPVVAVRMAYIALVGVLGMLLGHRWSQAVEARVDMAHEMARREHLLHEAERLRAFTDAAIEGILIHRHGRILEANPAACHILERPREELLGADVGDLVDPVSAGTVQERLREPNDGRYELWFRNAKGDRRRLAVQGRDITYKGELARVIGMRDITDEYEAQKARETAAAQRMEIERLQEIDRFRTRFINTAAHELNTPLTPIKLQLHLLREDLKHQPRALDMLERNLDRLGHLVTDMLDVARMQSGRLRIRCRTVDLAAVCEEVTEMFAPAAVEADVKLERLLPDRLVAFADPERVVQILTNLLSNAIKFTPGGHVTVVGRETRDGVLVEVIDTGRGVPADQHGKLFQPFSQAHEDPHIPGTGLGLYICKNLAEMMDGTIGFDSGRSGSRFWFELPREAPTTDAQAPEARRAPAPGAARPPRPPARPPDGMALAGTRPFAMGDGGPSGGAGARGHNGHRGPGPRGGDGTAGPEDRGPEP